PALTSNSFRPGAMADSLTSTGGYLPGGNGQMPITAWLDAGATASYGTVEEPCNYTQKFSKASVLIDQYYRGATLIEAYWKSVQWPGQGLFIGEPLAQPFRDSPSFSVDAGQYLISTRSLRANSTYALQYQNTSAGSWVTLGSFKVSRAQPQSLRAALPTGAATQLRWLGPCPSNAGQQCTLSTSP
ncbi:MAG: TIGR03790 family protein, partial [Comamonadaceae bacterium]